ncbi:E3 ubiquitin-protein ligase TRIM56-like [Asterias amurensis]|uniref:E3 ubiquitin-protein ligase TRIM56-like n=1 Tax=Asterias amurensis TaxID=7602 RepID=UPI003AB48B4B
MDDGKKKQPECALCLGRYQQPKLLECLHSFCANCLKKYRTTNIAKVPMICCPVCGKNTDIRAGIDNLKTNFYLIGLTDEIIMQEQVANCLETKLACGSCEGGRNLAVSRCIDCALYLCANCQNAHTRFAALSSHKIATLDEIKYGVVEVRKVRLEMEPKCKKHYGEILAFFCETCQELVCHDCTVVDHSQVKGHKCIDTNKAFSERKQSLGELFPALNYALLVIEQSLDDATEMKKKLQSSSVETIQEVHTRAAEVTAMVAVEEKRIIGDIKRIEEDRELKFKEHEEKMSRMREGIQHSLTTARELVSTASKGDLLTLYATISKELKSLGVHKPPKIDHRLSFMTFARSGNEDGCINLGNLVMEGKWEMCRQFGKDEGEGEFSCARGIAALPSGDIAVADQWNKRVVICNSKGGHKRAVQIDDYPFDVATFNNQLIVLDTTSLVKVYNTDKILVFEFPTLPAAEVGKTLVNLASVAVKRDGTIVIGDVKRCVLTEHRPADGSLIRTVPVATPPHYLAIDSTVNRVIISGADKRVAQAVDGETGATIFTIKPLVANDRVEYCTGVCCDSSGIFLAMHNGSDTGHIHQYDAKGTFRACVAQDLHYPMGIKMCAGKQQLAIADWTSVKIFELEHV